MTDRILFAAVDPGESGAFTVMNESGLILNRYKLDGTLVDVAYAFELYGPMIRMAYLEYVRSMPTDRPKSAFTFGRNCGFILGMFTAYKVPFEEIRPVTWMSKMQCMTGGDKNVTKQRAQQLWPDLKWTHALADSALIAECCRRTTLRIGRAAHSDSGGDNPGIGTGSAIARHSDGEAPSAAAEAIRAFADETTGRE